MLDDFTNMWNIQKQIKEAIKKKRPLDFNRSGGYQRVSEWGILGGDDPLDCSSRILILK